MLRRYDTWQPTLYGRISAAAKGTTHYSHGMPEETSFLDNVSINGTTLLLVDDLLHMMRKKEFAEVVQRIFTTLSHHNNITCFFSTQTPFRENKLGILHDNAKYLVLTKSHHDYVSLGRKYMPGNPGHLILAANTCFYKLNCDYLIVDNSNWARPDQRCKTGFCKGEQMYLFSPTY